MTISTAKDHILFTPGPLTTSRTTKQAMLRDLGSRDSEFIELTQSLRNRLLKLVNADKDFTTVLLQGSGTFSVESVISSAIPRGGKLLVLSNGTYGKRIAQIASVLQIDLEFLEFAENQRFHLPDLERVLKADSKITHVAAVHCETTTGIFNPIEKVGEICAQFEKTFIVDGISSVGAVPMDLTTLKIDYLVGSANKCIEGVPGLGFVIARRSCLSKTEGYARSLSLDLYSQWKLLEKSGEFRYTPPIQVMLALDQALNELEEEGGANARSERYKENHSTLIQGMAKLGFQPYLKSEDAGYIITAFPYLKDSAFHYETFYEKLKQKGLIIYSGKVSEAECFRLGNIGRIFKADIQILLLAIQDVLFEMKITQIASK